MGLWRASEIRLTTANTSLRTNNFLNMKKTIYLCLFASVIFCFTACKYRKHETDRIRLQQLDTVLQHNPYTALDSLKKINARSLNRVNNAYYNLLKVMAEDKTYCSFKTDSTISSSAEVFSRYKKKYPFNYARALMYQGIVRYRMKITDSTAYLPLKEAVPFFKNSNPPELKNIYLCYFYLAEIHDKNHNITQANKYYKEAVHTASILKDSAYLYSAYSGLFWISLRKSDDNAAGHYLDSISNYRMSGDQYYISYKNMQSVYSEYRGQYRKTIQIEKDILRTKTVNRHRDSPISSYYNISRAYRAIHQPDSALKYALLAVKAIQDTNFQLNHFYYTNLAIAAEENGDLQLSTYGYKKSRELMLKNADKLSDTRILELEKKYDLTEAENRTLHYKNRTITLFTIVLFLVATISVLLLLSIRQRKIKTLTEERNRALESEKTLLCEKQQNLLNENNRNEQELLNKQIILTFFQQVSEQNLEIKNLLYDLKINTYIAGNKAVYDKISMEYENFNKRSKIAHPETIDTITFTKLTGLSPANAEKLNKSEQLMLLLIYLNAGNREMAVLFNTSAESIRSRKLKLKKKLELLNIPMIQNMNRDT